MSAPLRRRRDPEPISRGWELAVALAGGALIVTVLAALVGVAVAAAWWGGGWVWPQGTEAMGGVVAGLLHAEPAAGFPPDQARFVASAPVTYLSVGVAEVAFWSAVVGIVVLVRRRLLPGDARSGMATRAEAERALGVGHLRSARAVIRPDLNGSGR